MCSTFRRLFVVLISLALLHDAQALETPERVGEKNGALFSIADADTVKISKLLAYASELFERGDLNLCRAYAERALTLSQSVRRGRSAAESHSLLARVHKWQGPKSKTLLHADSALALCRRLQDEVEFARALRFAVPVQRRDWPIHKRRESLDRALAIFEKHDLQSDIVECLIEQSRVHSDIGLRMRLLQHAIQRAESIAYERGTMRALGYAAYLHSRNGEYAKGQSLLERALDIARQFGSPLHVADVRSDLADMFIYQQQPDSAIELLRAAMKTFDAADARIYMRYAHLRLGNAYAEKGEMGAAMASWRKSANLARELFPDEVDEEVAEQARFDFEKRKRQEQAHHDELMQRRNFFVRLFIGGAILLALLLAGFYKRHNTAKLLAAKNETIRLQKDQLESRLNELQATTAALQRNLVELDNMKMELYDANVNLERKILERTTELYLKNKELNEETKEREQLQRLVSHSQRIESLGALAGGIAHDFNNILAIVASHASLLKNSAFDGNTQKRVDAILRAGERGSGLVRQLLALARKEHASKEPVYINDIVVELKQLLSDTLPHGITISLALSDSMYPILAEKTLIHQALLNLCTNARDAMPDGGRLTITTEMVSGKTIANLHSAATESDYVALRVEDTGVGMDEETQRRLFEPFFTTKEEGKGTGLGLAVTQRIVRTYKGFTEVQSAPGQGASLTLYFPAMQFHHSIEPGETSLAREIAGGDETILLVEDEKELLAMLRLSLEEKGYRVLTATNGYDAIEIVDKFGRRIDLLLSDIGLPGVDGVRVFEHVKAAAPNITPILMSGFFDEGQAERLRKLGVDHVLQKPFTMAEVLMRVREVLSKRTPEHEMLNVR
jgi:signal transduction histidine kinase/CheY-like chemotaxis protein